MSDNSSDTPDIISDLSPMKRALGEIRRLRAELDAERRSTREPIAVLGGALRLPSGVDTPERFWQALVEGEDLITSVPPERWDSGLFWNPDPNQPGTIYDLHGGFLKDVDAFDAEFFGINPREAENMDPQHRLLLEVTWEALERSSIDPRTLMNTSAGVFFGMSSSDYGRMQRPRNIDGYTGIGSALSIAAGRIAYLLGTHGPAVVTDTACSASLVALHQAVRSLRAGETDLAIVGGINLMLSPETHIAFARSGMLSPTGRCRTFDAAADGYVRSEGCGVVVLKRLSDARRDGHRVLATVHGSAVNQDGRSAGITAPNGPAQEAVLRAALDDAGVEPASVRFVETHGTGTPLGDPIELRAIAAVYGENIRTPDAPLYIGAVKANLGHTEAAAGITGLLKLVEMLQPNRGIPPHLHLSTPTPHVEWDKWRLRAPYSFIAWDYAEQPIFAAVSSFGFSGTNAHVIVGSGDTVLVANHAPDAVDHLLCLSAPDEERMRALSERYSNFLETTSLPLAEICQAALSTRARMAFRLVVRAATAADMKDALTRWLAGQVTPEVVTHSTSSAEGESAAGLLDTSLQLEMRTFLLEKSALASASTIPLRHVQLPTYPFRRKRFWLGGSMSAKRNQRRGIVYDEACRQAERQSTQAPFGWNTDGFANKYCTLVELTRAYSRNVLVRANVFQQEDMALSAAEVIEAAGFVPLYKHLVERWLKDLVAVGLLLHEDGRFRAAMPLTPVELEPVWDRVALALHDDPGPLSYLRNCGARLFDVLTGHVSALETLFPEGSFTLAEGIYEQSAEARYLNPIVAEAVRTAASGLGQRRTVRILEVGSGTGGTSASVLQAISSMDVEYWFTDLSEFFLERAKRRFRGFDFVRFANFDLDRSLEEQKMRPGMFDLVLAANVVHAAPSLPNALQHIHEVLAPGGILVLLETTEHQPWFDMSVGLIEGWQHFTDIERQKHPLLKPDAWCDLLTRSGFAKPLVFPREDNPAAAVGQRVILSQSSLHVGTQSTSATDHTATGRTDAEVPAALQTATSFPAISAASFSMELQDLQPQERDAKIATITRQTVHEVFRLQGEADALGDRDRLSDLGMDSLIALDLRAELSRRLGLEGQISSTVAFETGTIGELIRRLCELASPPSQQASTSTTKETPALRVSPLPQHTAEQLADMSDEDVEALLEQRLKRA